MQLHACESSFEQKLQQVSKTDRMPVMRVVI